MNSIVVILSFFCGRHLSSRLDRLASWLTGSQDTFSVYRETVVMVMWLYTPLYYTT